MQVGLVISIFTFLTIFFLLPACVISTTPDVEEIAQQEEEEKEISGRLKEIYLSSQIPNKQEEEKKKHKNSNPQKYHQNREEKKRSRVGGWKYKLKGKGGDIDVNCPSITEQELPEGTVQCEGCRLIVGSILHHLLLHYVDSVDLLDSSNQLCENIGALSTLRQRKNGYRFWALPSRNLLSKDPTTKDPRKFVGSSGGENSPNVTSDDDDSTNSLLQSSFYFRDRKNYPWKGDVLLQSDYLSFSPKEKRRIEDVMRISDPIGLDKLDESQKGVRTHNEDEKIEKEKKEMEKNVAAEDEEADLLHFHSRHEQEVLGCSSYLLKRYCFALMEQWGEEEQLEQCIMKYNKSMKRYRAKMQMNKMKEKKEEEDDKKLAEGGSKKDEHNEEEELVAKEKEKERQQEELESIKANLVECAVQLCSTEKVRMGGKKSLPACHPPSLKKWKEKERELFMQYEAAFGNEQLRYVQDEENPNLLIRNPFAKGGEKENQNPYFRPDSEL